MPPCNLAPGAQPATCARLGPRSCRSLPRAPSLVLNRTSTPESHRTIRRRTSWGSGKCRIPPAVRRRRKRNSPLTHCSDVRNPPRCQTNDSLTPNICPTCASRHSYDDFLRGLEVCGMTEHIHGDGSHTGKDIPDADRKAEMLKCVCSKILLKYFYMYIHTHIHIHILMYTLHHAPPP